MRVIAEFVMRGRMHAIGTSMVSASLPPPINFLSMPIINLVILRKGMVEGVLVLLWTLLPAGIYFYIFGDSEFVLLLLGTTLLAVLLRVTVSWEFTLLAAVVVSAAGSLIYEIINSDSLKFIVKVFTEYTKEVSPQLSSESIEKIIIGGFAMGQAFLMLAFLILARWWQSLLFNPGGFQQEFHHLRMSWYYSTGIVVLLVICFTYNEALGHWIPLLTVPLVISGLSTMHWLAGYKKMSIHWLIVFYLLFLLFVSYLYPLVATLALIDSYLDIRNRIQTNKE